MGIGLAAERLGVDFHPPTVGMRTGDTPADERRKLVRTPPDLLITTPESLYLMLTSAARETLARRRGRDRRRDPRARPHQARHPPRPQPRTARRALRAVAPAHRPVGHAAPARRDRPLPRRVRRGRSRGEAGAAPGDHRRRRRPQAARDRGGGAGRGHGRARRDRRRARRAGRRARPGAASIWPSIHPRLLELVAAAPLDAHLRQRPAPGRAPGHPAQRARARGREPIRPRPRAGRRSRDTRSSRPTTARCRASGGSQIEDELKRGELKGLVATSSLELGIDMGAVDLVIQVESPGAVSRGLQRIGRAGHQVGEPSRGKLFPKHRNDLVEAAVVVQRMHDGLIEHTRYPRNPLDVLAQQIVAMCALDEWPVDELAALVRRAAPFAELSDEVLSNVLDLLAGRYPSDEFAELRPRIVWERAAGVVRGRAGAAAARGHERRHHPRPRALRRVPARRRAGGRARRGDGLREPGRARPSCSAPAPGASRTSPTSASS